MANWLGKTLVKHLGNSYYASTSGVAGNSGTFASPWDLQSALLGGTGGTTIQPGDTLFVRGGTYTGLFTCTMVGTSLKPIIIRPYQFEQPTIDGYVTTTLSGNIDNVVTSIPMAQLAVPDNTTINIDSETIRIHSYSGGNYVSVDRGWNGTTAASHTSGATIFTESGQCYVATGSYCFLYGFEMKVGTSRYTNRVNPQAGSNPFGRIAGGIDLQGTGNKAINCIIHDCADGCTTANVAGSNVEFHGCLSYYNGWDASDRGHGHNFYIHNDTPSTSYAKVNACISLAAFDLGSQFFTGGATLGQVLCDGFIGSNAGTISSFGAVTELLIGLDPGPITASTLTNSALYDKGASGFGLSWGYSGGSTDGCTLTGNYVAGENTACAFKTSTNFTTGGNTWVGPSSAPNPSSGTFLSWKPGSGKTVVIVKNLYEGGRANVAVFNWDGSGTVPVDFSSFLNVGETYVVRNAWNYFGTPVTSGVYAGGTVSITASGLTISTPVGLTTPAETGPEFNCFVVSRQ